MTQESSSDESPRHRTLRNRMAEIMSIFSGQITSFAAFPLLGFIGGALMAWGIALILRANKRRVLTP